jgi:hypothetical protein
MAGRHYQSPNFNAHCLDPVNDSDPSLSVMSLPRSSSSSSIRSFYSERIMSVYANTSCRRTRQRGAMATMAAADLNVGLAQLTR